MSTPTERLVEEGVSIWLDDLSRDLITSGGLAAYISDRNVSGVTTNPTIFAKALSDGTAYAEQAAQVIASGAKGDAAAFAFITEDVRNAADVFKPIFDATNGKDGRVSIEVSPELAHDTDATASQAHELWNQVDKENILIKIPATKEGLPAITQAISEGISVNVTLIFSLERYAEVIDAYLSGLEKAQGYGVDISKIHSVASFFVSRVDTEVDKRLEAIGTPEALELRGKAGVANARLAYELYQQQFATDRAKALLAAGANLQRPLWASTGVKNPAYPDTMYVTDLVAPGTVNTMPGKTLEATFDHAPVDGDQVTPHFADAHAVFDGLEKVGIDFADVTDQLEREGVDKFIVSWHELQESVAKAIGQD
ncbi:transaldolase [Neoactinobaculum massilliense]|uniref:transaldolase n=1 Tax=Neoactinobaculum massilliense TaxID=2364794 RepID=UPI000F525C9B|nr:transaldolase [Neoactinobaculum massilliense]